MRPAGCVWDASKRTDDDGGHEAGGDHQRRPEAAHTLGAREVRRVPLAERHEAGAHLSGDVVSVERCERLVSGER